MSTSKSTARRVGRSAGHDNAVVHWSGLVVAHPKTVDRILREGMIEGWDLARVDLNKGRRGSYLYLLPKPNLVVNPGVQRSLDKLFGITGTPSIPAGNVVRMGVDNGTTNPVAASRSSDQGSGADTGSSSQTLAAFDSTPTRSSNVVTSVRTFNDTTTGGIGAVGFIMKRLFLSAHTANITNTTSADTQDTLYSMTNVFTIDFTSIATWSLVISATVTGAGT